MIRVSGSVEVGPLYSMIEILFIRSATAMILPVIAISMGAVEVRYEATFSRVFAERR